MKANYNIVIYNGRMRITTPEGDKIVPCPTTFTDEELDALIQRHAFGIEDTQNNSEEERGGEHTDTGKSDENC